MRTTTMVKDLKEAQILNALKNGHSWADISYTYQCSMRTIAKVAEKRKVHLAEATKNFELLEEELKLLQEVFRNAATKRPNRRQAYNQLSLEKWGFES